MARGRPSKRQHIIDIAIPLFAALGYQGTSIDQVVQEAAVSKPTVYSNFPTKQALWCAALDTLYQQAKQMKFSSKSDCTWQQRVDYWLLWMTAEHHLAVYRVMMGERHKMTGDAEELFREFDGYFRQQLLQLQHSNDAFALLVDSFCFQGLVNLPLMAQPAATREQLLKQIDSISRFLPQEVN
ncbi:TetR/AcrR family transcriptional regulator [Pokkaliibacter sp. CJK22405]|uniref:TetR/AcrR family transcriptional regulator n=1 Tax=Pokkaliibacter sp. CJK22405 TaxID=3384615 RepID=UPI0039850E67